MTYEIDTFYIREIFTQDDGFNVAYALTEYDAVKTPIDDPQYGTLRSYHYGWGQNGRGSWLKELKTGYCSDEELHLTDSSEDSKMFQIHELSINDVSYYRRKFQCIKEDTRIQGSYNSDVAQQLVIQFEKCNATATPDIGCKSDEDIQKWL